MNFKQRLFFLLASILILAMLVIFFRSDADHTVPVKTDSQLAVHTQSIPDDIPLPFPSVQNCRMHMNNCFNIYQCGYHEVDKISIYVYPLANYFNDQGLQLSPRFSREFYDMVMAIKESNYYTTDMEKACLIVPPLDLLNQGRINVRHAAQILSSLPSWTHFGGRNHLIFNMIPGQYPDFNTSLDVQTEKAVIVSGGFSSWSYRPGFDVSIPIFNSLTQNSGNIQETKMTNQKWFLISTQVNFKSKYRSILDKVSELKDDVLVLNQCSKRQHDHINSRCEGQLLYMYPQILKSSTFCLVIRGMRLGQSSLMDAFMMGCIPVVVADGYVMPFSEVIDWPRAAVMIREDQISNIYQILKTYTSEEISDMRKQGSHLWSNYFSSMKKIALTTIKVINDRIFPNSAWSYEDWNTANIPSSSQSKKLIHPPFSIPLMSPKQKGFTALVLTYDRVSMLFRVLTHIAQAPSLVKIVVVWNNVNKRPPPVSEWPKLTKPVEVIETKANKLTNRFFPYNEIETEAIFSLDDDIVMLTIDEIQFAFEVWSEYPDRLVGFPGRLHTFNNTSNKLKYESEWLNDVSIVLSGAAFHHKYFNQVFTYLMPVAVRDWVDEHMNCEDIAMNFLVANYTGKPPIKVTPRKRFKCPECANGDALGANQTAEFRADPILHQDDIPIRVKRFKNVGTI